MVHGHRFTRRLVTLGLAGFLGAAGSAGCVSPQGEGGADAPVGDASLPSEPSGVATGDLEDGVSEVAASAVGANAAPDEPSGGAEDDAEERRPGRPFGPTPEMTEPDGGEDAGPSSPSIGSFALYATEAIEMNSSTLVTGCNVGVENETGPFLGGSAAAYFNSGATIDSSRTLYAYSVYFNSGVTLGALDTDQILGNHGATYGAVSSFPAMPQPPALPSVTAGTTSVTLNSGQSRTLAAGAYAGVTVNSSATLSLSGGAYVFSSLTMNSGSTLAVDAATTIAITGSATFNSSSFTGPASGSELTAKGLVLYLETSSGISLNSGAQIQALLVATNARVTVNTSKFTGALAAAQVVMNSGATITCQDGFGSLVGGSCSGSCDDGNPCTADACSGGSCTHVPVTNGTACNDGDACTQTDACAAGLCVGTNPVVCTASDQCHTAGSCNSSTGQCSNPQVADGVSCNDGNACTQSDACESGVCTGSNPVVCSASDQCHAAGACNTSTGQCSNPPAPNGTACNDGSACDLNDSCQSGTCTAGSQVICTASDQCHTAGTCNTATGVCSNPPAADGTTCSDGDACTQTDACATGVCVGTNPVTCSASDQCHTAGTCDPSSGVCSNPPAADGTTCSDGDACTQTDACATGACVGANPVTCTASDQCHTAGTCDPSSGVCSNPPAADGVACSDGNACDLDDSCQSGACTAGGHVVCNPVDACHLAGTCNPASGQCSTPTAADGTPCSDGNLCVFASSENCLAGACTGTPECGGAECLSTQCAASSGQCAPSVAGTPCSTGACDGNGHCASGTPAGAVTYLPPVCPPPPSACSTGPGVFDPIVRGCYYIPAPAGTTCPAGVCDGDNQCVAGGTVDGGESYVAVTTAACPVASACANAGSIDFATGTCAYVDLAAGTACAGGACDGNGNCAAAAEDAGASDAGEDASEDAGPGPCDDQNPCTVDILNADRSCSHYLFPDGTECRDGNVCNAAEACTAGVCVGTKATDAGTTCRDGTCNGMGTCSGGGSSSGGSGSGSGGGSSGSSGGGSCSAAECNDGNPCTTDGCNSDGTCSNVPVANGTACDDLNACTQADSCQAGACAAGAPVVCVAPNGCEVASCNPATGCVYGNAAAGMACADNSNLCVGAYDCDGNGDCVQGPPPVIDTSNPCVIGSCSPATGVTYTSAPAGTACGNNANLCATTFVCDGAGTCDTVPPPAITPPNVCFTGACNPATGSVTYAPVAGCDPNPTAVGSQFETQASFIGTVVQTGTGVPVTGYTVTVYDDLTTNPPRTDTQLSAASDGSFWVRLTAFPTSEPARTAPHHEIVQISQPGYLAAYRSAYVHPGTAFNLGSINLVPLDPNITTIDQNGGTAVDSKGLVEIVFPAGALTGPTPIQITAFKSRGDLPFPLPDMTVAGYSFDVEPDGLQLQVPATVHLTNWRNMPTNITLPVGVVSRVDGTWTDGAMASWDGQHFTFQIPHFSAWDGNPPNIGEWLITVSRGLNKGKSAEQCGGSTFGVANGTVRQSFPLPGVTRRGQNYAVGLNYDSLTTYGTDESAPAPTGAAGAVPTSPVVANGTGIAIRATCLDSPGAEHAAASTPGSCTGGACGLGGSSAMPAGLTIGLFGAGANTSTTPPSTVPSNGSTIEFDLPFSQPTPLAGNSLAASGYILGLLGLNQGGAVCTGPGTSFGSPQISNTPTTYTPGASDPTPVVAGLQVPSFVYQRHSSAYGAGWGIDDVGQVFLAPEAEEAVLVSGRGDQEVFYPRVEVTQLTSAGGAEGTFANAMDPMTQAVYRVSLSHNAIEQVNTSTGAATTVLSGLALPSQPMMMAIGYVNGVQHFLLALTSGLVDVASNGTQRTLMARPSRTPAGVYFFYASGVAVQNNTAYYVPGNAEGETYPVLYSFDLTQATPPTVTLSNGNGNGEMSLRPQGTLSGYSFGDIHGLAPAADGGLYVADRYRNIVFEIEPDANGVVAGDSKIVPIVGTGGAHSTAPLGIWEPAAAFTLPQPGYTFVGPDGELWIFTSFGAAIYDPLTTEARWLIFDNGSPKSELNFSLYATGTNYTSYIPVGPLTVFGSDSTGVFSLNIVPLSSATDPTRTLSVLTSPGAPPQATLIDTTQDLVEAYDGYGRLVERQDREGDTIFTVSYVQPSSTNNAIAAITDPLGGSATFAYSNGVLQSITDAAGRPTTFSYNDTGDLTSFMEPDGEVWQFQYADHRMTQKTSPDGDNTFYAYAADNTLTTITKPAGETYSVSAGYSQTPGQDANGNPTYPASYTDTHGVTHSVTLDELGRPLTDNYTADGVSYAINHVRVSLLGEYTSPGSFDPHVQLSNRIVGRVLRTTENGLALGLDNNYDPFGRWVSNYDDNTNGETEATVSYDANGRVSGFRPGVNVSGAAMDSFSVTRDANGRPLFITETNGRQLGFTWYANGLLQTSTAHGVTTTYQDDPATLNVASTSDTIGRASTFTYDAAGNVSSADDDSTTWQFVHDPNNRLQTATDQEGNVTTFSYLQSSCGCSESDLLASLHTPDLGAGLAWQFTYGKTGIYPFGNEGRLTALTDPDGNTESYTYQPSGELVQLVDRNNHQTNMAYDHLGRVTSIVDAIGRAHARAYATPISSAWSGQDVLSGSASATSASTNFAQTLNPGDYQIGTNLYDTFKLNSSTTATHGWAQAEFYRDATFQLSYGRVLDNFGRTTNDEDRPSSQLTSGTVLPSGSGTNHSEAFFYESNLPAPLISSQGTGLGDTFTYDTEFDLATGQGDGSNIYNIVLKSTVTTDVAGRVTNLKSVFNSGLTVNQPASYIQSGADAGKVLSDPQGTYTYDDRGLVHTRTVAAGVYTYGYDALGRNSSLTYPDGHTRTQGYDNEGRINQRCYQYTNGSKNCYGAVYDPVGNPLQLSDPYGTDVIAYDPLDRVTSVSRVVTGDVETYSYNAMGALQTSALVTQRPLLSGSGSADSPIPASFNGQNIVVDGEGKITSLAGVALTYTLNGQVATVAGSTINWDEFHRVAVDGTNGDSYTYDGWNRSGVWVDNPPGRSGYVQTQFWLYDGVDHPLEHDDYLGNRQYYEVDLAGNVRRLVGPGGTDLGGYRYTAFGEMYESDGSYPAPAGVNALPVRWKGRWLAYSTGSGGSEIDLYDMRARWWCPQIGSFLGPDAFKFHNSTSTLWAWWSQNPVRFSDPTGHYIGEPFSTPEEAAIDAIHEALYNSVATNTEFGGWVVHNTDGTFSATLSNLPSTDVMMRFGAPPENDPFQAVGGGAAGRWHTHAACEAASDEDFSPADEMTHFTPGEFPSYVGTPSGAVRRFDPDDVPAQPQPVEPGQGPACDPNFCSSRQ